MEWFIDRLINIYLCKIFYYKLYIKGGNYYIKKEEKKNDNVSRRLKKINKDETTMVRKIAWKIKKEKNK